MKRIVIWMTALLLIAGSWGGNVWYYNSMQLAEPMFLPHFIAIHGMGGEPIDFYYLENQADAGEVVGIQIEELPPLRFNLHESSRYSHHVLMKASAYWEPEMLGAPDQSQLPMTIREITVHYNGRAPKRVPIGEVLLMPDRREGLLNFIMGGASSDGTGNSKVRLTRQATLEKVDYAYSDRIGPGFRLELDGQPIEEQSFPRELREGDLLEFTYAWLAQENERIVLEGYQIKVQLHFRTPEGRTTVETIPVNRNVYLSEAQVKRLVRAGGELP